MGWGTDLMAGLSGAAAGGLEAYRWEQDRKFKQAELEQKDRHDTLVNDIKIQLSKMGGEQKLEQIDRRQKGQVALTEMLVAGRLDERRLANEGSAYIAELHAQNVLDAEEAQAINRMDLATFMQSEAWKRAKLQAETSRANNTATNATSRANNQNTVAASITNTNANNASDESIAGAHELGVTNRFNLTFPLDVQRNERLRVPRQGNTPGTQRGVTQPMAGPSYEEILRRLQTEPAVPTPPVGPAPAAPRAAPAPASPGLAPPVPQMSPVPQAAAPQPAPVRPAAPVAPRSAAAAPAPAPSANPRQSLAAQINALASQIEATPPGPQQTALKRQLAALRAQARAPRQ